MSACRSCGAEIVWAVTEKGKRMPVDAAPVEGGNIALEYPDVDPPVTPIAHVIAAPVGVLYVSHFATCPNAASHRRRAEPVPEGAGEPQKGGGQSVSP